MVAWFMLDCACSILAGAYLNVVLNIGFLAMSLLPLAQLKSTRQVAA